MKTKTVDLIGAALDWAVAKCEGREVAHDFMFAGVHMSGWHVQMEINIWRPLESYQPSTDWAQGGPISEREEIDTYCMERNSSMGWHAEITGTKLKGRGRTKLIAAMRCYVASQLGDEIDVPEELLK